MKFECLNNVLHILVFIFGIIALSSSLSWLSLRFLSVRFLEPSSQRYMSQKKSKIESETSQFFQRRNPPLPPTDPSLVKSFISGQ